MRPTNILFLTADDLSAGTPGCFGGPPGVTPRLDALAAEGMTLHRAHVPIAVCQPSRSAMLTGRWPHRNGAEGFQPIADGVPLLTDMLRGAGYRAGILGKVDHLQPVARFGWDHVSTQAELGMGRDPVAYGRAAARFFAQASGPWFLMANAHDPHRPFAGSDDEPHVFTGEQRATYPPPSRTYSPREAAVPGFLPDLPAVRREVAQYQSSARRCDDVVGAVLDALAGSGAADDTLVVFLSDNGMAFPFAKANCYLQSTATPMVVRWPGRVAPGCADRRHFVSGLDLFPTFCAAAGVVPPADLDGTSLADLFAGTPQPGRDDIVTVFHETSGGRRFDMRCVQDGRFGYVWNAWSDGEARYRAENMDGLTWQAMVDAAGTDEALARRVDFYLRRTPEELYRLDTDPYALDNVAADPRYTTQLAAMRDRLAGWMAATGDPLASRYAPVS